METTNCWGLDKRNMGVLDIEDKRDAPVILTQLTLVQMITSKYFHLHLGDAKNSSFLH